MLKDLIKGWFFPSTVNYTAELSSIYFLVYFRAEQLMGVKLGIKEVKKKLIEGLFVFVHATIFLQHNQKLYFIPKY